MDIDFHEKLFSSLQHLARELNYPIPTKFDEFVDFYEYLKTHHPKFLYEDDEYYILDNLEENLIDFATKFENCSPSPPWKLGGLLNIGEEISHMITAILLATQENIQLAASQPLFTLEEFKQSTKEAMEEFLAPLPALEDDLSPKEKEALEHKKGVQARLLECALLDSNKVNKTTLGDIKRKSGKK